MMEYNLFKEVVANRICDFLPPIFNDYKPVIETVNKINEKKDALTMHCDSINESIASPVLYLDEMYKMFIESEDMDLLLQRAAKVIVCYTGASKMEMADIDFNNMLDRVIPNLIGRQLNEELLRNVPYKEVLDMAVIYRIMMPAEDDGFHSLVINNSIFEKLEIDIEEMHYRALENLRNILPMEYNRITKDVDQLNKATNIPDSTIFVYTKQNIYGAAYILDEKMMKWFCNKLKCNKIYVVPASINYFVVCEAKENCLGFLLDHLYDLNHDEIEEGSILSKCIYCFDVDSKALTEEATYDETSLDTISSSLQ